MVGGVLGRQWWVIVDCRALCLFVERFGLYIGGLGGSWGLERRCVVVLNCSVILVWVFLGIWEVDGWLRLILG